MEVGFRTICATSAYHHYICEFEFHLWRGVLDVTLCYNICERLATGGWFSPGTPISSTNKTDRHDITEILLKVELNTIAPSFSGGGSRSTRREPPTRGKQLVTLSLATASRVHPFL